MAYNLIYKVPFKSVSGTDCEVRVEGLDYTGAAAELIGGGSPFTTSTDTSDLLTPIRASTATLSVYGSDYLRDLYTSNPQGVRVSLLVGGVVAWLGYMTPDTFSQDFSKPEFVYDIECVSAISTLKYKKFTSTSNTIGFLQLIKNAALLAGYEALYLTKSVQGEAGQNIYEMSYISTGNFFDELGEAMNYYEILEELAKFLVCTTFVPNGKALYLVDYQSIRNGFNDYFYYDLVNGGAATSVTLSDVTTAQALGYKGTGATVSRIAGKNKATVKCSLYEVENVIPEFSDKGSEFVRMETYEQYINSSNTQVGLVRHFKHPDFTFYRYEFGSGGSKLITPKHEALSVDEVGSGFVRTASYKKTEKPASLSFQNEVVARMFSSITALGQNKYIGWGSDPLISAKSRTPMIFNKNLYFLVSYGYRTVSDDNNDDAFEDMFEAYTSSINSTASEEITVNFPVMLRAGNYVYNGTSWEAINPLQSNLRPFDISVTYKKDDIVDLRKGKTPNTNTFDLGIGDEEGYVINPMQTIETGYLELTLFAPFYVIQRGGFLMYKYIYLNEISLKQVVKSDNNIYNDWVKDGAGADVVYENIISSDYIEEAEEVELRICTNTDGKLCLSSVMAGGDYLSKLKYLPTATTEKSEHLILQKVISTYSRPRFSINPTLSNRLKPYSLVSDGGLTGVQFLNAGGDTDWKMESTTTTLIEL